MSTTILPALARLALLGALCAADVPRYAVAPGTELVRRIECEHELRLERIATRVDGVDRSPSIQVALSTKQSLEVRDEVRAVGDGRPLVFRRLFDLLEGRAAMRGSTADAPDAGETIALEAESPLEGVSVVHTWVPQENDYGRYYDGLEVDERFLEPLRADLDLLGFLPPSELGEPAAEATWDVDLAALRQVLAPGGELDLEYDAAQAGPLARPLRMGLGANLQRLLEANCSGAVRARWAGVTSANVDGEQRRLARIEFEFEVTSACDQTERMRRSLSFAEFRAGMSVQSAQVRWSAQGRGSLTWDLAAGVVAAHELAGEETYHLRWEGKLPGGGAVLEVLAFSGTLGVRGSVRARR